MWWRLGPQLVLLFKVMGSLGANLITAGMVEGGA